MEKIKKPIRELVRKKFGGKCAFCGYSVDKGMHIWDIDPIQMIVTETGELQTINTQINNLFPACKSCASVRKKYGNQIMTIDQFRKDITDSFQFLRSGGMTATSYGRAIRFGLIVETGNPIKFYFEIFVVAN